MLPFSRKTLHISVRLLNCTLHPSEHHDFVEFGWEDSGLLKGLIPTLDERDNIVLQISSTCSPQYLDVYSQMLEREGFTLVNMATF